MPAKNSERRVTHILWPPLKKTFAVVIDGEQVCLDLRQLHVILLHNESRAVVFIYVEGKEEGTAQDWKIPTAVIAKLKPFFQKHSIEHPSYSAWGSCYWVGGNCFRQRGIPFSETAQDVCVEIFAGLGVEVDLHEAPIIADSIEIWDGNRLWLKKSRGSWKRALQRAKP